MDNKTLQRHPAQTQVYKNVIKIVLNYRVILIIIIL